MSPVSRGSMVIEAEDAGQGSFGHNLNVEYLVDAVSKAIVSA